jgi:hypothetical protein
MGIWLRGDTRKLDVACVWDTGLPIDLSGAKVWATFKTDYDEDDAEAPGFQLSTTSDGVAIVGDPADGRVLVTVADYYTANLPDTTFFYWDVQIKTADGQTGTPVRGTITFEADVTLATS